MQCSARLLAITATLALTATGAHAAVTISSGATANMSCSNGVCAPTAPNAVLNSGDLEGFLASGNLTVTTTGSGVQAKDIVVKAMLTWSAATVLAFDSHRSITLDRFVSVAGAGGLALTTNDGGKGGELNFGRRGHVEFVNLASSLTVDGKAYTLVNTVKGLASVITNNPTGNYAFADSYNAGQDGVYSSAPVASHFGGNLEGLGNSVSNLAIKDVARIGSGDGLFALVGSTGLVRDFNLTNVNIYVKGYRHGGYVPQSVGGLAAENDGWISNSYATGEVENGSLPKSPIGTGGLVGVNYGVIANSSATIQSVGAFAGGVDGINYGVVTESIAAGFVDGGAEGGGLVGENESPGVIMLSFATASIYGCSEGGLVGDNSGNVTQSYATGSVSGSCWAGEFAGSNSGTMSQCYATGAVSGGTTLGGFVGADYSVPGSISNGYWDTDTSGITNLSQGAGNVANDPGITGLTTAEFQSGLPAGFDPAVWGENSSINGGLPYLLNNPPPK
ncbi:MAG: hypothetical protein WA510_11670 [Acidobacteriaceae bacterium]